MEQQSLKVRKHIDNFVMNENLDSLNFLCEWYQYIAEGYYSKYIDEKIKTKAKVYANEILKQAIIDFCMQNKSKDNYKYNIANFIYKRFLNFESKFRNIDKVMVKDLEKLAYLGNYEARVQIFKRRIGLIQNHANKFYDSILESYKEQSNIENLNLSSIIMLDREDIYQEFYMYAWEILNKYYSANTIKVPFTIYLPRFLSIHINHLLNLYKKEQQQIELMKPVCAYEDPLEKLEEREELAQMLNWLNNDDKNIMLKYSEGMSYKNIGNEIGMTRQGVCQKVKKIGENLRERMVKEYERKRV